MVKTDQRLVHRRQQLAVLQRQRPTIALRRQMLAQRFEMRLKVPGQDSKIHYVDFSAMSLWSREDVTPGSYDTGFALITPSPEIRDMIDALHHYFSFRPGALGPFVPPSGASTDKGCCQGV